MAINTKLEPFEKRYSAYFRLGREDYEPIELRQNLQANNGDHWRVKLNLKRWRRADELVKYLRWAADQIESMKA